MAEEKTIRTLPFDGNVDNWREWKVKFLAKARHGGYKQILTGEDVVPDETDPGLTQAQKDKIELNYKAYDALVLACEGVAFGCVESAVTDRLKDGCAALAWKQLNERYEPKTQMSLVLLKKEFAMNRLEDTSKDPDAWVQELEHIRMVLNL